MFSKMSNWAFCRSKTLNSQGTNFDENTRFVELKNNIDHVRLSLGSKHNAEIVDHNWQELYKVTEQFQYEINSFCNGVKRSILKTEVDKLKQEIDKQKSTIRRIKKSQMLPNKLKVEDWTRTRRRESFSPSAHKNETFNYSTQREITTTVCQKLPYTANCTYSYSDGTSPQRESKKYCPNGTEADVSCSNLLASKLQIQSPDQATDVSRLSHKGLKSETTKYPKSTQIDGRSQKKSWKFKAENAFKPKAEVSSCSSSVHFYNTDYVGKKEGRTVEKKPKTPASQSLTFWKSSASYSESQGGRELSTGGETYIRAQQAERAKTKPKNGAYKLAAAHIRQDHVETSRSEAAESIHGLESDWRKANYWPSLSLHDDMSSKTYEPLYRRELILPLELKWNDRGSKALMEQSHHIHEIRQEAVEEPQKKPKEEEILDMHQYFANSHNVQTLINCTPQEQIHRIDVWAKELNAQLVDFEQTDDSIEYFVIDQKLMKFLQWLDKIDCKDDPQLRTSKVVIVNYINGLCANLDSKAKMNSYL